MVIPEVVGRVAGFLGAAPERWVRAEGGYTPAERWIVRLADGRSVFAKGAVSELTARWLRAERHVYGALRAPYLPEVLAWEDGDRPVLVLEDLSGAHWPPPWRDGDPERVLGMLEAVARTPPPDGLRRAEETWVAGPHWTEVARDPEPFLSLGIASRDWLSEALPVLREAEDGADLHGDRLLHLDVRSDNLCIADDRVVLVDWNGAGVGDPAFDVAFWAPSLRLEGGPLPEVVSTDRPELAAVVAGLFAAHAGLPAIPDAPRVRWIQLRQLRIALPWAARVLGLPGPDLRWAQAEIDRARAAFEAGEIDADRWHALTEEAIGDAYLAADDPRAGSGKSGDETEWRWSRELVLDALPPGPGPFTVLDVGCANGYLMESLEGWGGDRGVRVEAYGLEISERLASIARRRVAPERVFVGNATSWRPPFRFDLVHTGLDYAPPGRERELIRHALDHVVVPGGRLVLRPERVRDDRRDPAQDLDRLGFRPGGVLEAVHPEDGTRRRTAWVAAP